MLDLRPTPFDHPDAVRLIAEVQQVYLDRYGDADITPVDPREFAAPLGYFVIGYAGGIAVACGGWRAREEQSDLLLRRGDAEIKRMYVTARRRGRGFARAVLADLERTARSAGRLRAVLETGSLQPEAIALYLSAGYTSMPKFGSYRCDPDNHCFGKPLAP